MSRKTSTRWPARAVQAALILWGAGVAQLAGEGLPEKRVALVIGESHYGDGTDISGVNNADAMTEVFEDLNFRVVTLKDAKGETIGPALTDFSNQIKDATLVAFFYSGHGFHQGAENFLLPVKGEKIPLGTVLNTMRDAPAATKLVILDACRDIPASVAGQPGFMDPPVLPDHLLLAYAASVGQTATAGGDEERSPYTTALVRHLREAGVMAKDLFDEVRSDVAQDNRQLPVSFGEGSFYLRPAVHVRAVIDRPESDSDLLVMLNGEIRFDRGARIQNPVDLVLRPGDNPLTVLASSQRTYHNTQSWEKTEGWGYCMRLFGPGGTELELAGCNGRYPCFSGSEDAPFKDGSHHGKVFTVARAVLHVDPVTAALTLSNLDTDSWKDLPPYEQNQGTLDEVNAKEVLAKALNVEADSLLGTLNQVLVAAKTLYPGLPSFTLPDISHWVARVHGNLDYRSSAQTCMRDREADRLRDLRAGVALIGRDPRPLKVFDDGLSACIQADMEHRTGQHQEVKIWTAFEDLSEPDKPFSCPVRKGSGS